MLINLIEVDKYVAIPYTPASLGTFPFPTDPQQMFTISIQLYNDDGTIPTQAGIVYVGDRMNRNRIQYWKDDVAKTNFTEDVLQGQPIDTDDTGYVVFHVGVNNYQEDKYPGCIFDLYASPTNNKPGFRLQTGTAQTLTCCYTSYADAMRTGTLNSLVLSTVLGGMVTIPPWSSFQYSIEASLQTLQSGPSTNGRLAIVVNGKRADKGYYTYQSLLYGVDVPYSLMVPDLKNLSDPNNVIVYVVDDGNGYTSIPWRFPVSGVPLTMPDPTVEAMYVKPWWLGADEGQPPSDIPLTMDDLLYNDGLGRGLYVKFRLQSDAKTGDVYRIYIYLNGQKDGQPRSLMLGDGADLRQIQGSTWRNVMEYVVTASDKPGDPKHVFAPLDAVQHFEKTDSRTFGYMWFDYQVNGQHWSHAYTDTYLPVPIDLGDVPPTWKDKEAKR